MTRVHVNPDGSETVLDLNELEERFYLQAVEKFKQNLPWNEFDEFAFGPLSPIYNNERKSLEVMKNPLYGVLEDMWIQLGIQQSCVK